MDYIRRGKKIITTYFNNTKSLYYTSLGILGFILLTQINVMAIVLWIALFYCIFRIIQIQRTRITNDGIISFLPSALQKSLYNRSLFDFLCDIWYLPQISLYAKAFLKPFFIATTPEEAA